MSREEQLRRIEGEVGVLIRRVKRVLADRARAVHPDLHPRTWFLLSHLVEAGPRRASDVAERFAMDKGDVSRQVQQLVDLGLVERTPDPDDRRAQLLAATPDAVRRTRRMERGRSARFDERLGDWSEQDLVELADRLARYNAALED